MPVREGRLPASPVLWRLACEPTSGILNHCLHRHAVDLASLMFLKASTETHVVDLHIGCVASTVFARWAPFICTALACAPGCAEETEETLEEGKLTIKQIFLSSTASCFCSAL